MEQARLEQLKRDVIGLSQRSNRNPNYNYVSDNQKPDVLEEPLKDMNTDNSILPDFSSVNPLNELKKTNAYKHMFYSKADVLEEARKINKATGIPENAMLTSPENMDKAREIYEEREKQLDINAVYKMYPGLEKLATMDETAAAIALHDLKNVKTTHGIIEAAKTGWYMDELQHERNELGRKKYQQGISIAEEKRIKEIEEELRNSKQIPDLLDKPLEAVIGGVSQQLPMMARNFLEGQLLGIAGGILGAGVGAAAGSLGGAAGIAAGAAQGARYGYSLGARAGYGAAMFDDVVGGYYLDYLNYKDKNGQQLLTDEQAMSYATVTAVIESGIEMANIGKVIDILKGSARTAGAASGLREIIRGAQDTASMRAQLKNWLKDNSKAFGFIAVTESAEEGVQEAASMGITNVAAYNNPAGNIPMYSAGEIAQGGLNAAAEALPAALGFGGMAVAGRGAGIIRDIAALNEVGQTEINGRLKNIAGVNMLEKLVMDRKSNKLAQEHPETYEALVKQTLGGSQFNNVYVDTLSLSEDKEGTKILNQLLSQTSISAEQAESIKESKDDLVMHTADYLKFITNNEELREKLYKYISFDAAANSFARNKTLAEKLKKDMDSILAGEAERTIANIDNLVNETFTNEDERELAKYLIFQYDDTKKAVQEFIKEQNAQLEEMYAPIIKEMEGGMKQGVAKYYDEETGKWLRASNNAAWYSNYFAENNKAPGKNEMRDIARDILLGKNEYGLDGYDLRNEAAQEWIENNKVQIEQIEAQIELAKKIDEKLQNIKKEDLAMMESLTESGVKVYKKLYELFRTADNKSLKTAAGMNALLFAYRSERFADAMRRSGKKDYKAEDYLARFNFVFDGNGNGLKQENIIDKGNFYTVNLTGNEFGKFADLKDLRSKAVAWYRDNLQGTTAYNEYLGKVRIGKGMTQNDLAFSSIGRKKMSHTSAKEEKLLSVMYLKELIENANFITESDGSKEKHEGEHFYYLHTKLHDAQNNELYLIVNVKEDMYGRLMYYNHNIFNADEYKKIEDAYTENPEPWISSPGVDNQKAPSFTNSITGKGRVYKQQGIVFNQTAYHGTPHSFEQFDLGAIGSGAGAQMHGWGLYFAKNKSTAKKYQKALEEKGIKGQTFQVDIPDNKYLLDEQKSFREQAKNIQKLIVKAIENLSQEQQKKFFEEILGNKLSESRATIDAKKILSDNESIVRALDGLINPPKSKAPIAFLKRIRLETLNRVGYSNEQIEQMSQSPEMVEAEKAKYSEAITEAQNRLKEAQASDEIKNAEKLLQAVSNPAEALQSNIYIGEKIYTAFRYALSGKDYNSRLASEYLNKQGIKGITYDDYKDGRCFVVFDDAAIGVINRFNQAAGINVYKKDLKNYSQSPSKNYIKGQAQINSNGSRIIYLYKYADQSTFIHEMAHVFFDDTRELASLADAPDQIKKDYETLVKWAEWQEGQVEEYKNSAFYNEFMTRDTLIHKAQANGGFVVRKDSDGNTQNVSLEELLYEWQQERFARGFERYIASGHAPNTALRGVFSRFARWLAKIYRSIKNMGVQPSEEVRAVMDRMIASQEEIDLAAKKAELEGFEKAGGFKYLTDSAENMWLNIIDEIKQSAEAKILKVAMYDLKVEAKKEREEKVKREREAARERISQEPVFIIQKAQQSNPKLNIEQAAQQLGNMTLNEYIAKLKEYGGSLDNAVEQYMTEYEKELDKNIADEKQLKEKAEVAVHSNKYKKMLTAYEYAAIERAIAKDVRLNKQLGKESKEDKNVETIVRMRSRVNRFIEKYTKRMNEQSDVFNKLKKGQRGLRDAAKGNVKLIDEYAESKVALMPLTAAAVPALWHKKSKNAAELANIKIVKDDWDSALRCKKYQLVYDSVAVLAEQNKEFLKKQVTKLNNRHKTILRSKNMNANDRYLYNHLLYVFGIIPNDVVKPSTYGTLQDVLISYDKNLELQFVDEDGALNLPDWFMNAATAEGRREKGFTDLTIGQFKDFIKIMDNLYTVAINEKKLKKITDEDGKSILVESAVAEINNSIMARRSEIVDKDPTKAGTISKKEQLLKMAGKEFTRTIRPETIIEEMGEPAERYLFNVLSNATNKELEMTKKLQNELSAIMDAYKQGKSEVYKNTGKSDKEAKKLAGKDMENLRTKKDYKLGTSLLSKENVLAIALNWGTDINRKRVMDGYKVSAGEVDRLLGSLDSADWQFVINIWNLFDKYWQDIVDVEARITGVVLEKQEAREFTIIADDGTVYTIKGGYYPLKYDPLKNTDIQQKQSDESKRISMSDTTRLGIGLGTTKERSSGRVGYKIKTDLSVISDTLSENIHMIAMREAVRDVNKIINNVEFANTVKAYFGDATYTMLQNWVLDCWASEPKTKSNIEYLMQKVRHGQTAAVLGFRITTALLNINNISPMMDYIGVFNTVDAVKHFYKHPLEHYDLVMGKSILLRNRAETMDRDIAEIVRGSGKAASAYNEVQKMAFWLITKTDLMLACPLWLHEYERVYQELIHENKMPLDKIESKAVEAGDKAVRKIFGSNRTVDMAEIQRGSEIEKMLTIYYSYFSVVHNAMISKGYDYARNKKNGKLKAIVPIAKGILFWYIVPAVMEAAFKALISDSEDEPEDIAYKAGANVVNTAVGGLPIIRDVVPMVLRLALDGQYYGMSNSPLNEGIDQIIKTFNAVKSDKKDVYDVARESLRSIDMFTGISMTLTDALVTSLEWLDKGEQNADDILHYLWAILFAKDPEKNKNVNYKKL